MTLTLLDLKRRAQQARGGAPSAELTDLEVVNDAGNHLYTMHRWKFADRAPVTLDLVANQEWVDLPGDFGQLIHIARGTQGFQFVSPYTLNQRRAIGVTATAGSGNTFWVTTALRPTKTVSGRPQTPRTTVLLIVPTPSTSSTAAATLAYRAGWVRLLADSDLAEVPIYAENLLKTIVRAFALGYEEDSLEERLGRLRASDVYRSCADHDGTVQQEWGPIGSGSAVDTYSVRHQVNPLATESSAGPS